MKLNNKGMSLVEIIISVALISIVLIFIFSMLVNVNDINKKSEINSAYLVHKALFLKNVEEDLRDATSIELSKCGDSGASNNGVSFFYSSYKSQTFDNAKQKISMCIKMKVIKNSEESTAYLGLYYYKDKSSFVISYIRNDSDENVRVTRDFPNFEANNIFFDTSTNKYKLIKNPSIIYENNTNHEKTETTLDIRSDGDFNEHFLNSTVILNNYSVIKIPIVGDDGMDYTMLISYRPNT